MKRAFALSVIALSLTGIAAACTGSDSGVTTDAGAPDAPTSTGLDGATDDGSMTAHDGGASDGSVATNDAADAADATVPTPPPDYLWYVMDETSGTIVHDATAHHYDVTVANISWNVGGIFDGQSTCGEVDVGPTYRSPPLTISAWVVPAARIDSPTTTGALTPYPPNLLSDDIPGVGGYSLGLNVWSTGSALAVEAVTPCTMAGLCVANGTQNAIAADAGKGPSCTAANACDQGFVAGTEYLVTVAIDAPPDGGTKTTAQIYVNGKLFDQDAADVPSTSATSPIHLGCHNTDTNYGTARFFDGHMRDVRVYQRHLDAPEVGQLFANGPTLHAPM